VIEGLHPFYDERVRDLIDFKIYLDISDEIKFAWKIQRDMAERGHSLDSIKKSIEARKPDFDAYIDPQKKHADMIIQVCGCCRGGPLLAFNSIGHQQMNG
jgi:phosphoribulokinase